MQIYSTCLYEGSSLFSNYKTIGDPHNPQAHRDNVLRQLREQYFYRPTQETLWAEVKTSMYTARYKYNVQEDRLTVVCFATVQDFYDYCTQVAGIQDAACEAKDDCFVVFTKSTRMTSHLMNCFSSWEDVRNSDGEYSGYRLKLDHTDLIKHSFFNKNK